MRRSLLSVLAALAVAACGGQATAPTPTPDLPSPPTAVPTAVPTETPSPEPSSTPSAAPPALFQARVVAEGGARIRAGPGMDQRIVTLEPQGTVESFDTWYRRVGDLPQPDPVSGRAQAWSRDWYHLTDKRGWMHATVLDARAPPGLPQAEWKPPQPPAGTGAGRRIVVSLAQQHLWGMDGDDTIVETVIASGRPDLATVTGRFTILGKFSPYLFRSPWPPGSQYWYLDSWTSYAMEFESTGFFIHDAPWRTEWGPGANLEAGTHGCVNVPIDAMTTLYRWAQVGDVVVVVP